MVFIEAVGNEDGTIEVVKDGGFIDHVIRGSTIGTDRLGMGEIQQVVHGAEKSGFRAFCSGVEVPVTDKGSEVRQ